MYSHITIYMDILQMATHLSYRKNTLLSMAAYKSLVNVSRTYVGNIFSDKITIFRYTDASFVNSNLHTNKCTLCMYTYTITHTLYSHSAGLSTTTLSSGERKRQVVYSNTLLPNKVILVQIFTEQNHKG